MNLSPTAARPRINGSFVVRMNGSTAASASAAAASIASNALAASESR